MISGNRATGLDRHFLIFSIMSVSLAVKHRLALNSYQRHAINLCSEWLPCGYAFRSVFKHSDGLRDAHASGINERFGFIATRMNMRGSAGQLIDFSNRGNGILQGRDSWTLNDGCQIEFFSALPNFTK